MVVVPLPRHEKQSKAAQSAKAEQTNWVRIAAGGTLVAGGLLLLTDQRRAGLAACATGTALAMLDQQEAVRSWWNTIPVYIDDLQRMLDQVQGTMQSLEVQRDRLRRALSR
jgi:hypothetical protein